MNITKDLSKYCVTQEQKELWAKIEEAKKTLDDNAKKYNGLADERKELTIKTNKEADKLREQYKTNPTVLAGKLRALQINYSKKLRELKTYNKEIPKLSHTLAFQYEDMRNRLINMIGLNKTVTTEQAIKDMKEKGLEVVDEWGNPI